MARASAAASVPRVRMNRILGTGQTGGGRVGQQQQSPAITMFTSSTTIGVNEVAPSVQAGSMTSNCNDFAASAMGTPALVFGKATTTTAAAPAQKKVVSFFRPLPRTNHLLYRTLSRLSRRVLPLMADNSPRANTTFPRRKARGSSDCYDQRSGIGKSRVTVRDMTIPMLLLLEKWERRRRREVHLIPERRRP